jgi:uncharacterized protein (TIGR03067 family)
MKPILLLAFVAGVAMAADGPAQDDPSAADLAKLRGTWSLVSLVNDGKSLVDEKTPPNTGPATTLSYEGNKWAVRVGDQTVAAGVFTIDPSKNPKEIDILDESGKKNDKTKLGIYEISGDTYKYCLGPAGKPRPKQFTSKEGTGDSLGVMKRKAK